MVGAQSMIPVETGKATAQGGENVLADVRLLVIHRGEHMTGDGSADVLDHPLNGFPLLLRAIQGEVAGFDGNQRFPSRPQGIECEQADGWGAIDEAHIVSIANTT